MQRQIVFIHGGNSYESNEKYLDDLKNGNPPIGLFLFKKRWKDKMFEELMDNYQAFAPNMPSAQNANYEEWKIWFEKMIPFVNDGVILIGHSKGGLFLAKYLSENIYPKKIIALMMVSSPYTNDLNKGGFKLEKSLASIYAQCKEIHLFHSKDDPVVSFDELEKYKNELPEAKFHIFEDRGHFLQENFPEIVEEIKKIK